MRLIIGILLISTLLAGCDALPGTSSPSENDGTTIVDENGNLLYVENQRAPEVSPPTEAPKTKGPQGKLPPTN